MPVLLSSPMPTTFRRSRGRGRRRRCRNHSNVEFAIDVGHGVNDGVAKLRVGTAVIGQSRRVERAGSGSQWLRGSKPCDGKMLASSTLLAGKNR